MTKTEPYYRKVVGEVRGGEMVVFYNGQITYYEWYADWKERFPSLRLGQHFVNQYIKHSWPELYYCESDERSGQMIFKWLTDHCYFPNTPTKINDY